MDQKELSLQEYEVKISVTSGGSKFQGNSTPMIAVLSQED